MNRIDTCMKTLAADGRKALIPYIVGGDGADERDAAIESSVSVLRSLSAAGADLIELGYPFSDPMAEGPVIQRAHERALAAGINLAAVLEIVTRFRSYDSETPLVLMGYANPVEQFGREKFADAAVAAGVDGLLVVDMDPAEARSYASVLAARELEMVFLIAPTTSSERLREIISLAGGYIYCITLKGVTGADKLDIEALREQLGGLRELTSTPLCAGFGIRSPEMAVAVAHLADGVVVGSLLVAEMEKLRLAREDSAAVERQLAALLSPWRTELDREFAR